MDQQITRDVFPYQLIIGDVGVERRDDVVPILIGIVDWVSNLLAAGFGVPRPIPASGDPSLAENVANRALID